MARAQTLGMPAATRERAAAWRLSWPLLTGAFTYLYLLFHRATLLRDGDTYWHVAAGRWIMEHGEVPTRDPFSHTMRDLPWMAHEWLSEIILAAAHQLGGWTLVVAVTALTFAVCIALLTRTLLRWLEPVHVILFAAMALFMTAGHALARPHMLAMPLMMVWVIELVRASEDGQSPRLWLLPIMTLWANMHGGFTLGIALTFAFAAEALWKARERGRLVPAAKSWGMFIALTFAFALATPHGLDGVLFTWRVLVQDSFALQMINEWKSPDFHIFQPLELWLLGGLAFALHQGFKLPLVRLALLLGLLHLALKHARNIELLGLLAPLLVAQPLAAHWKERRRPEAQAQALDRLFTMLSAPAGRIAVAATLAVSAALPAWMERTRPVEPSPHAAPVAAVQAARDAGARGPVLNEYEWGGYLVYAGIAPFVDGRADVYGDDFLKDFVSAMLLRDPGLLEKLIDRHGVQWTLLRPGSPVVGYLDRSPEWRRVHADTAAVVHVRKAPPDQQPGGTPPEAALKREGA